MNKPIFITGHRNPDTDSICSAMDYANLKQLMGENAIACRLGPLNEESKFVTKYFDVEGPLLIKDARAQLRDIDVDEPTMIHLGSTVKQAWDLILGTSNRSLMVVDDKNRLQGIISTSNLSTSRLLMDDELSELMSKATVEGIADTVKGQIIFAPNEFKTNGRIYIATSTDTKTVDDLNNSICIISYGTKEQIETINAGCKCMIVSCGQSVNDEVIALAQKNNCAIIRSELDTMRVSRVVTEAYPIDDIMTKNPIYFLNTEYVNDVSKKMSTTRFRSYPILNEYGDIMGQVSRFHLQQYRRRRFILVDHSARNQSVGNIDDAEILEIIDHHHIGDIQTDYPIYFRNQRCGCTASIIASLYQENGLLPDRVYSGVLLSAIISDTLYFKSKTTTDFDVLTAKWLADRAEVNLDEYAQELLSASVDIKNADLALILKRDLKTYSFGKYNVAVGQTNYRNIEDIQVILDEFRKLLKKEQKSKSYDLIIMMFTQVTAEGTMFVYTGPLSYIMDQIIEVNFTEDSGHDSQIISRKQQLVPKMSQVLKRL